MGELEMELIRQILNYLNVNYIETTHEFRIYTPSFPNGGNKFFKIPFNKQFKFQLFFERQHSEDQYQQLISIQNWLDENKDGSFPFGGGNGDMHRYIYLPENTALAITENTVPAIQQLIKTQMENVEEAIRNI
ncbi:MAG: hypothetical protein H0X62_03845 [Bacteroidetes bacterium]|nr:hypothetical protein [Bacteroidota bacterium]